jgi:hypothetical protein
MSANYAGSDNTCSVTVTGGHFMPHGFGAAGTTDRSTGAHLADPLYQAAQRGDLSAVGETAALDFDDLPEYRSALLDRCDELLTESHLFQVNRNPILAALYERGVRGFFARRERHGR